MYTSYVNSTSSIAYILYYVTNSQKLYQKLQLNFSSKSTTVTATTTFHFGLISLFSAVTLLQCITFGKYGLDQIYQYHNLNDYTYIYQNRKKFNTSTEDAED